MRRFLYPTLPYATLLVHYDMLLTELWLMYSTRQDAARRYD